MSDDAKASPFPPGVKQLAADDTAEESRVLALSLRLLSRKDHNRIAGAVAYYRHEPHAFDTSVYWWCDNQRGEGGGEMEAEKSVKEFGILARTRHTWCLKATSSVAAGALLRVIPWDDRANFYFSCVDTDFEAAHLRGLFDSNDDGGGVGFKQGQQRLWPPEVCRTDTRHFALTEDKRRALERRGDEPFDPPVGCIITPLDPEVDAAMVAKAWPYNYEAPGAPPQYVIRRLQDGPSVCIRDAATREPFAFALTHAYGSIGILHVFPEHRRKGYAVAVLDEMARILVARGKPVFANTVVGNEPAMALMRSAGYEDAGGDSWIFWDVRENHPPACG